MVSKQLWQWVGVLLACGLILRFGPSWLLSLLPDGGAGGAGSWIQAWGIGLGIYASDFLLVIAAGLVALHLYHR